MYSRVLQFSENYDFIFIFSDTMTPEEIGPFKRQIMKQIIQAEIRIYEFPEDELMGNGINATEEIDRKENKKMKERVPFAVVGSNCLIENADGRKIRGRRYPWGIVDVSQFYFLSYYFTSCVFFCDLEKYLCVNNFSCLFTT